MSLNLDQPRLDANELQVAPSRNASWGDIFIRCPRMGVPVSTGLKTEWVVFRSLPPVAVPLRCPACGQVHKWRPQDAWIGPEP